MSQNKKKSMWIDQQQIDAGSEKSWLITMIKAIFMCEVLLMALIELTKFTDIYTPWVMVIAAGVVAGIYGFLIKLNKQKIFYPGVLILLLAMVVVCGKLLLNGFCTFWNQAGNVWTAGSGVATAELESVTGGIGLAVFSVFAGIVFAVLCCAVTLIKRNIAMVLVPLIVLVGMIVLHGDSTYKCIAACLVVAMCLLAYGSGEDTQPKLILNRWIPVIVCGALMLGLGAFSDIDQWASSVGENVHDKLHSSRYETEVTTLPEGDFSDYVEKDGQGQTALVVSMEKPEEMYFRGFTAAEFDGNEWTSLNGEILSENEELLYWLNTSGFNPQTQYNQALSLTMKNMDSEDKTFKKVTVQNLNACSAYLYVPYSMTSEDMLDSENISTDGISGDDNRMYTYAVMPEGNNEISKIIKVLKNSDEENVKAYRQAESAYREFVHKYYLEIPEETEKQLTQYWDAVASSGKDKENLTTAEAQSYARAFLEECFPEHGDAPEIDLPLEVAKGSSYQYATVAVLTLRHFGIPTRYVEGYAITEEMAAEMKKDTAVNLDENCAGAWAEVYQDGIGWIPMNLTPGIEDEDSGLDPDEDDGDKPQETSPKSSMKLDNFDDMSEEPEPDGGYVVSIKKVISFTALLIAVIVILLVITLLIRRHILLNRRMARWNNEVINDAVAWIFADTELLLKKLGFDRNGGSMMDLTTEIDERLGTTYAGLFKEMVNINSRAVFSSRELEETNRETAKVFYMETLEKLKEDAKWHQRAWMKWVLCLS